MDIDCDGINDVTSGSYGGKIIYYKGTKNGYEAPKEISQTTDINNVKLFDNYLFTNPTFSDFNGDGLLDAFIGGSKGMRYMLNEGTKENPMLGDRMPILDVEGNQICLRDLSDEEKVKFNKPNARMTTICFKTYVHHIDWDNDGVKDIIATSSYTENNVDAVLFFKGIETKDGIRFGKRIPLFTAKDGSKALPGTMLIPYFYDINNDGALDLLLGAYICFDANYNIIDTLFIPKGCVIVMLSNKHYRK